MNYSSHYDALVTRAKHRVLEGYSERHHIIPCCLGGSNSPGNIVRLTPEEHYTAHILLVKMYPGDHRLLWAASCMTGVTKKQPGRSPNKLYGWLRRRLSEKVAERMTGRHPSLETLVKLRESHLGVKKGPRSAETRAKIAAGNLGKPKSAAHRAAMSAARTGVPMGPRSEEWKERLRQSNLAALATRSFAYAAEPKHREKQSEGMAEVWRKRRLGLLPMPVYRSGR